MITRILFILQEYLYLIGTSFIIIFSGFGLGFLFKRWIFKILKEIGLNNKLSNIGIPYNAQDILSSLVSYGIYVFTIIYVLKSWGITSFVFYFFLSALLILIALTILVGIKGIIPDLIARFLINQRKLISIGKNIKTKEIDGKIIKIGFLETQINTTKGDTLFVPNSFFLTRIDSTKK
jgi:small-conductance mechanosensitive channel